MIFSDFRRNLRLLSKTRRIQKKNHGHDITRSETRRIFVLLPRAALVLVSAAILAACGGAVNVASTGPSISLTPQATTIKAGASTSLVLQTSSATSCVGTSGISGPQPVNGTIVVPDVMETTTFAVTCTGPSGTSTAQTEVIVLADAPTITLTAAATTVPSGGETTLTWMAVDAQSCTSSNNWNGTSAISGTQSTGPLTDTTEYTLLCTGPGGSAQQSVTVTVDASAPVVQLTASPSTASAGSIVTLNYSAANATSCSVSGGGWSANPPVPSGSVDTAPITGTTTYTLTCTGTGGSASQSATVSVNPSLPTVSIVAGSSTIPSNTATTINWSSANATACTASGAWSGNEPVNGSVSTGNLTHSETYSLTCAGPGGSATQAVTVTVSAGAPTVTFSAGPSAISAGSSSTLTWSATNATSCTASGSWSGSRAVSGSQSTGALTATAAYTLTCTGAGGNASQSATVSVSAPAPTVAITANPSTVVSGNSSTITWVTTNATACTGAGGGWSGSEPVNGSVSTGTLTNTTTYTLSCTGSGGNAAQSTTVTVTGANPVVTISANPSTVTIGNTSTLTWSSTNTTSCTASNGWTGDEPTSGSQTTVALSATTKFVLNCTGPGGTAQNSTTVSVSVNPPTVSLTANPSSVASGGSSTLTWSSKNASSCAASGAITGSLATSGSQLVTGITSNATYTLTCTNAAGSNSVSATVTVPPTIGGSPATTATVGTPYSFTPTATGALGAVLTFSIQHKPSWASFNTTTGALTGTPSAAGTFGDIIISVTDGITAVPLPAFSIAVGTGGGGSLGSTCSASSGPLNLNAKVTRSSGISPLLVFLDATGTTDSALAGNTTAFQDVTYSWNFGDTGASGTGNWAYGSNAGANSRNSATGGVAAHLYITNGNDTNYTATVTATDGTNTASCQLAVTAHDPAGANGFPGSATTCVSSSATPVAGAAGCPAGAAVLNTGSAAAALSGNMAAGKRVLFKCGDRFTGGSSIGPISSWSVGAYGSCEGTQSNRPIFSGGINIDMHAGDGRVSDLDFESTSTGNAVISTNNYDFIPYQITLWNLNSSGNNASYYFPQEAQLGLIQVVTTGMGSQQGTFINYAGNNASQWGTNSQFNNLQYLAIMGGSYNGQGATNGSAGIETVRISQGQYEVIENNLFENANNVGAVLKVHAANSKDDNPSFTGMYNEYIMNTDNLFTGTSGAQLVEYTPQNPVTDERLRYIVNERNIYHPTVGGRTGLALSAANATVRDNAVYNASQNGIQVASRGIEPTPQFNEVYNNSCTSGGTCVVFAAVDWATSGAAGANSFAQNNLCYGTGSCVSNNGSGNAVSNNTSNTGLNPGFTNGSTTFDLITDWQPTANYSGGMNVPVYFDALGAQWSPTWELGALHP